MRQVTTQATTTQPSYQPVRKVIVGAFTGALITLIVLILNTYSPFFEKKPISGEIAGATTTLLTFIVSYFVSPSKKEYIALEDDLTKSARK
ncbi:MAG: hypothetical protein WBM44_28815 [Waterburya sp.]